MATSSFKSTSRRSTTAESSSHSNANSARSSSNNTLRRSRSVSSIARTDHKLPPTTQNPDYSEFSNPLFFDEHTNNGTTVKAVGTTGTTGKAAGASGSNGTAGKAAGASGGGSRDEGRGRSVTRTGKTGIGRSLSRVRVRSVSRTRSGEFQSEKEDLHISTDGRKRTEKKQVANSGRSSSLTRSSKDVFDQPKCSQTRRRGQAGYNSEEDSACSIQIMNWEDSISICSFSEAEEKTTVHEQTKTIHEDCWASDHDTGGIYETVRSEVRRAISDIQNDLEDAIKRNNAPIATADIRPDLVNPGAIELVLGIRREYAKKLEESEERARKLKADLSIEEQCGKELSKILKEILPEPKTSTSDRPRSRRKRSSERKNLSRCLTEEAMAYFDECVSISTFDSSDFSAPEDPPHGSVNYTNTSVGNPWRHSQRVSKNNLAFLGRECSLVDEQIRGHEESGFSLNNSSNEPTVDHHDQADPDMMRRSHCAVLDAEAPAEIIRPHSDIISYVKQFAIGSDSNVANSKSTKSSYDADGYKFQGYIDGMLFDKVLLRSRIESGGLHLCSGGFSLSPFNFS